MYVVDLGMIGVDEPKRSDSVERCLYPP
jgi:hypothetical protein